MTSESVVEGVGSSTSGTVDAATGQGFWRRYFAVYDTLLESIPYRRMIDRYVELLSPRKGELVLDAGTGTGNIAVALAARGARVVGIDFCPDALDLCRRKLPAGEFSFGDLTATLDLESDRFDKIACCNVLYTLEPEAQRNAAAELFRVLKPGGMIAATVFAAGFSALKVYREVLRLQFGATGFLDTVRRGLRYSLSTVRILYYVRRIRAQRQAGAYTFFTPQEFTALLAGAGFELELLEPALAGQCLTALAHKPAGGPA